MGREHLAGLERDDGDFPFVDDREHAATPVGRPDPEVMETAGPAQGHGTGLVHGVVAEAQVAPGARTGRHGLGRRPVDLTRRPAPDASVRSLLVVGLAEGIELGLQLDERPRGRLLAEPALEGPMEAFDLALGLGMVRGPVLLADAEVGEQVLEGVVAAREARGVDRTVESPMDVKS